MVTLYRVSVRSTHSLQPGSDDCTSWSQDILYCGYDRDEARRIYHESTPADYGGSYGCRARETTCEVIEDAETEDFADDVAETADLD
jgi:hypothetical protein